MNTLVYLATLALVICTLPNPTACAFLYHDSSTATLASVPFLTVSGFIDVYYAIAFAAPPANTRAYTTQPLYHNDVSINFALASLAYTTDCVRGRFAVHVGSYVEANYAAEPPAWRNIFEANAGYRLQENLWIDAGIFTSHIGAESAISKDNWTYSRSIVAEYSPYYETGVKLTWTPTNAWLVSALVLNGWQLIRETNSEKSFGTHIQWKPTPHILANWSTYLGNDQPDSSVRQMRYFSNLYTQIWCNDKLSLLLLFDIGMQEHTLHAAVKQWLGGLILARYGINDSIACTVRCEYYSDPHGIIISTGTPNNFQTFGASVNIDITLTKHLLWRLEGRWFASRDPIYPTAHAVARSFDGFIATSLALSF
ncbi:MAG: porin [Bacteroidota bacterium]|nr:porin [Candidatus Kapabacteria bacterium]MDW8219350.1 porin [Bacteroidota bacterium]